MPRHGRPRRPGRHRSGRPGRPEDVLALKADLQPGGSMAAKVESVGHRLADH
ncbi:hypothetical protein [Streptomyces sp. NPDC014733]|uniref:hypothetical protein n=1 Tax=Streptomyces sp. NPDC014733 TaxID=3364885 RepID=UPI0036FB3911